MTYSFDFGSLLPYWPQLAHGALLSLGLAALTVVIGFTLGLLTALARGSRFRTLQLAAISYIEVIRNTPFLLQVMFIFFGLPAIGISLPPWPAAILALSLNCAAFSAEIIRAGIEAVPRGQFEAGAALGLRPLQVFRYIVLKPSLRVIYPALTSQFILALLTTSIVSSISAEELTSAAQAIDTLTFRSFEIYIVATGLYLAMASVFSVAFKTIERAVFAYPTK